MKKTKRKASRLTVKSTDEEVIRWTKSYDVFDRLEKGVSEVVEDHRDLDEGAEQACAQRTTDATTLCPYMTSGTVGTGTQSRMNRLLA